MPDPFGQPQSTDIFKRASTWLDELYKPVSEPLGSMFGAVGRAVSPRLEQPFAQVGRGLPRLATEAFLSTRGAALPKALGFGDVALQSMGQTADQGLSPAQRIGTAGLQTAAFAAAPKAAEALGPRFGAMAAPLTEKIRQVGGKSLGALMHTTAEKGGSLVGMLGTFEGANAASAAVMGQPDYFKRMLEPEHIASTVATVLPFEALGFPAALKRTFDVRRAMDERQNLWYDKLTQQDAADREAQRDVLTRQREEQPEVRGAPAMEQPQGPELITHSAFVPDPTHPENVEYGAHHPEILDRLGVKGFEQRESRNTPQFGYKTTARPFITREEASALMNRTGQKLDLEAPIQPHSDEIPSATGVGTVAEQGEVPRKFVAPDGDIAMIVKDPARAGVWVVHQFNREGDELKPAARNDFTNYQEAVESLAGWREFQGLGDYPSHLSKMATDDLRHSESLGADARELAEQAKRTQASDSLPNESVAEHAARVNGITREVLEKADPQTLLRTFTGLTKHIATTHLGWSEDKANFWAEKAARLVGMIGQGQGETRVFPATAYVQEGVSRAASFYVPRPNPFIGLYVKPFAAPERAMFEFFHSLGHELFHGKMEQLATRPESLSADEHTALTNLHHASDELKLSTYEMGESIQGAIRTMVGAQHKGILDYRQPFYKETPEGRVEYMADLFGLQAMGAASDRSSKAFKYADDIAKFGNDNVRNFAAGVYKDIGQLLHHVADMLRRTFGWKPSSIKRVEDIVDNMKALIRSKEEGDRAVETFLTMMQAKDARPWQPTSGLSYDRVNKFYRMIQGEGYDVDAMAFAKDFGPAIVPQEDKSLPDVTGIGKRLNPVHFLMPQIQLAKALPEWADVAWLGRNLGAVTHAASMRIWSYFNEPGKFTMDLDSFNNARQTGTAVNKLLNKCALLANEQTGDNEGQFLPRATITAMPEYKALNTKDRAWVDANYSPERWGRVVIEAALRLHNKFKDTIGHSKLAHVAISADPTMPWRRAEEVGSAVATLHFDQDRLQVVNGVPSDPELFAANKKAKKFLEEFVQQNPESGPKVLKECEDVFKLDEKGQPIDDSAVSKDVRSLVAKAKEYRGNLLGAWLPPDDKNGAWHFKGKPGWSSEVRLDKWHLAYREKEGNRLVYRSFEHKKDFDVAATSVERRFRGGGVTWRRAFNKEDQQDLWSGADPEAFGKYDEVIAMLNNRIFEQTKRQHPEATELLNDLQNEMKPSASKEFAALLEAPYMKERRLVAGREHLNMVEGLVHYIDSVTHSIGKQYAREQHALFLRDPKMKANPNLAKYARQYFDELINPKESGLNWAKALMAFNYIFFSPSLAFVEGTQQLTNHLPALAAAGMPYGEAIEATVKANYDMANAWKKGKSSGIHIYESKEENDIINRFVKDGLFDYGWLSEQYHKDDVPFINRNNVLAGNGQLLDRNGLVGKALYHTYRFGRDAHGMMITINNEVAALSAYRYFKSKGMEVEDAYRAASDLTQESMHGGGRSNRPLWYLGVGKGSPGATVGGVMYCLQMYVYNSVSQMCRYGYNAMFNSGLTPTERASFAKGFASMIGSQLFFAGVMGIPVTSQMFALVEQRFPNTEPKRRARELFYGAGKWLNDKTHILKQDEDMGHFVENAAMDGLMGQVTPVQLSNRFELGVLLGVDPYQGFSWKNVVGPGGSLLEQILLKPAQALAQGHPLDAAIEMFPNSNVRRLATLASNGWQLRNKDDRLNSELTAAESALLALGFTPTKVADFRAQNEMKRRAEKVNALEQKKFHESVAQMVVEGRLEDAQIALVHRAQTTEGYSPREGARRVAELVQSKTEPFDPYDKGSRSGGTYNVSELFPQAPPTGSEVDRALRRAGLVQQLGFPESLSRTGLAEAQYIDELRRTNPMLTRQEARQMLERQLHPSRTMW